MWGGYDHGRRAAGPRGVRGAAGRVVARGREPDGAADRRADHRNPGSTGVGAGLAGPTRPCKPVCLPREADPHRGGPERPRAGRRTAGGTPRGTRAYRRRTSPGGRPCGRARGGPPAFGTPCRAVRPHHAGPVAAGGHPPAAAGLPAPEPGRPRGNAARRLPCLAPEAGPRGGEPHVRRHPGARWADRRARVAEATRTTARRPHDRPAAGPPDGAPAPLRRRAACAPAGSRRPPGPARGPGPAEPRAAGRGLPGAPGIAARPGLGASYRPPTARGRTAAPRPRAAPHVAPDRDRGGDVRCSARARGDEDRPSGSVTVTGAPGGSAAASWWAGRP